MNFTAVLKCQLNFILEFSTSILTEKLQSHFFAVTEILNSQTQISNVLQLWNASTKC